MHRCLYLSLTLCLLVSALAFSQAPVLPQGGVVSAASLFPLGAPGYKLAPGSIVSLFGTNLATSTAAAAAVPLPTTLGGAGVTIGGVAAGLYYASAGQINAQIPYTVAIGSAVPVVVTTSAGSSGSSTIPVVAAAPALFSAGQNGQGSAAALNYVSATSQPYNGFNVAIAPGSTLEAFGTGGGSLGSSTPANGAACGGGSFSSTPVSATIGGVAASVQYAGCAPGFVGLDQWNIVVPNNIPAGCYLPLQVSVNNVISNSVTIAVALNGNCSSALSGQVQVGPNQSQAVFTMNHIAINVPGFGNITEATGGGSVQRNGSVALSGSGGLPPAQAGCYVYVYKNNSSTAPTPGNATVNGSVGLDAGTVTLKTPSTSINFTENPVGSYNIPASANPLAPAFTITPGTYSLTGAGGKDVGVFGPATLNIPALLNVTNPGFTGTTISQSKALSPTLTCPDPAGEVVVVVGSQNSANIYGAALCSFACAGNISVPSSVLQQLPTSSGNAALFIEFVAPNNNSGVTSIYFTASGVNVGLFQYYDAYGLGQLSLQP